VFVRQGFQFVEHRGDVSRHTDLIGLSALHSVLDVKCPLSGPIRTHPAAAWCPHHRNVAGPIRAATLPLAGRN
jgi:hypothetical protein